MLVSVLVDASVGTFYARSNLLLKLGKCDVFFAAASPAHK